MCICIQLTGGRGEISGKESGDKKVCSVLSCSSGWLVGRSDGSMDDWIRNSYLQREKTAGREGLVKDD